jgi:NADH-quinone oxidoreductase subunit N
MGAADVVAIGPMIILGAAAVLVMLAAAFHRHHGLAAAMAAIGLAAALVALWPASRTAPRLVTPLLIVDRYAIFYTGLICVAALAVAGLAYDYFKLRPGRPEEFYVLLLLATLGSVVLVASSHFASFFLGLEILSVSLYAMIAYPRGSFPGTEAAIKYLVLAATSAAFLLFGMAIVYADTGTMALAEIGRVNSADAGAGILIAAGLVLMLVGIGFKLAVVPFHLWTPDVYQGSPAPVTAFVATVSKGAMFALLLRFFRDLPADAGHVVLLTLAVVSLASMFAGNLLALLQDNVKRILAYSSIAHLGYLLVAFLASGRMAPVAVAFYLAAYFVTTLGALGVVALLSGKDGEADRLADYRGLAWRRPWLAAVFSAMLLSLAGIPLTAGFVGKFLVLASGTATGLWWLVVSLVASSVIGLFYYLRVLVTMYVPQEEGQQPPEPTSPARVGHAVLFVLGVLLLWLGVYPGPFMRLIVRSM